MPRTSPTASVVKITPGPLPDDSFTDAARLAKADKELNAVYAALRERLDASATEKLKTDQRAWIEQRDQKADQAVRDKSSAESGRIVRDSVLRDLTEQRKVVLGFIGPGGMGTHHIKQLCKRTDVEIAYVCDVDQNRLAKAAKASSPRRRQSSPRAAVRTARTSPTTRTSSVSRRRPRR